MLAKVAAVAGDSIDPVQEVYLWPDNARAWDCWCGVQNQWRVGMQGASGLDYAGVRAWLLDEVPDEAERRDVWRGIQACEAEQLNVWAEQRQQQQG